MFNWSRRGAIFRIFSSVSRSRSSTGPERCQPQAPVANMRLPRRFLGATRLLATGGVGPRQRQPDP